MKAVAARCPEGRCPWAETYHRPDRARAAAASHRCRPGEARQAQGRRRLSRKVLRVATLLRRAAAAAAGTSGSPAAVDRAWEVLNADRRRARAAFTAWCRSEEYPMRPEGLGGLLRSRYRTAGQVRQSLRAAARMIEQDR